MRANVFSRPFMYAHNFLAPRLAHEARKKNAQLIHLPFWERSVKSMLFKRAFPVAHYVHVT